ncbi:TetR/AcrR family transcriptional regulator [Roseococcus sp. DSY-14]|uniref:TetR/AcrR family transcriptional regulator n=1 Tax=Roseococcus sp. DSY-14 TaxID=3369650 RepID=UPI00387B7EB4
MDGLAPPADARTRILDAVEAIVMAKGVPALTLEAAAREAGVSKGGLLYHFASKEALLAGALNRLADHVEADYERVLAETPAGPNRATRALLNWTFEHPEAVCAQHDRAGAVFLAAFHHDPALLDPVRAVFARLRARMIADGLERGRALAIMAASDGLFAERLFRLCEPPADDLPGIRAALEALL